MVNCIGDVYLIPSSGTGAMELAVENFTRMDDKVLVVDTGFFGECFYKINIAHGRNAIRLELPWGRAAKPEEVINALKTNIDIKAVFLTHNETSSTIVNDIKVLASKIRGVSDALIIVDTVSSIGITEIDMENWGLDVIVAASQKGLMSPPGIGITSIQGSLKGKAFRIGHMGFITSNDLLVAIAAIECTLKDLGFANGGAVNKFIELRRKYEV